MLIQLTGRYALVGGGLGSGFESKAGQYKLEIILNRSGVFLCVFCIHISASDYASNKNKMYISYQSGFCLASRMHSLRQHQ